MLFQSIRTVFRGDRHSTCFPNQRPIVLFLKLEKIETRYKAVEEKLANPEIASNPQEYAKFAKEESDLSEIVHEAKIYRKIVNDLQGAKQILTDSDDDEMLEMAQLELEELEQEKQRMEEKLRLMLVPKDPQDARNAIIEIRAGTGGDEAGLFAGDLYRMYERYAEQNHWKLEIMSSNSQGIGGFREMIFSLTGKEVFGRLKFEGGVHRVQRVPATEASGRIHTSAASVAVLPEAEDIDIKLDPNELRIDVYRSSGPGGQSVNTTDSAVRITHVPTGMVVTCQDEKSQHKNKAKALKVLRSRLYEKALQEEQAKLLAERRSMVSTGDRSAKIRTYNFPQNRVTDHRIGLTLYKLEEILLGDLDEMIDSLQLADRTEKLKAMD
ncbi:peptide chain release factor 1 [candidate division KSB1 bacterium]|nr:peptide chain release factor 1 [candidate division KSB1 bacterium]